LTGSYKGNNLLFEVAGPGDTLQVGDAATGVIMSATAASNPRISLVGDLIAEGSQPNTITAKGGTVELAPFTGGRGVSLLGTAGSDLLIDGTLLSDINTNTGTIVVGQFTDAVNGGTLNVSSGNISIDGAVSLAGGIAATLDLVSQGSITELELAGSLTVGSLIGNALSGTLLASGNSIGAVAFTASNGDVLVADSARLNVGSINASNGNIYLASSNAAGINAAGANVVASATGRIGFKTDAISGVGTAKLSSGTLELAPFSSPGTITLGAAGGLSVVNGDLAGATATLWRFGAVTEPGGSTPTTTANTLVVGGAFGLSTVAIELDSTGAISETAFFSALTADTVTGTAGTTVALEAANAVNTLNGFSVASGSFTFGDGGVASLAVNGTVSAANVTIDNVASINVNGTVSASGTARLIAGSGGVLINAGALVKGGTVDLGSAAVGGGASVTVNGMVSAANATIDNVATINVNGTVSASDTARLSAGSGGVLINAGALVKGGTVDLDSAGDAVFDPVGAVIESGGGLITAGTLISSTGVKGHVSLTSANSIGAVGMFFADGNFDLIDSGVTNLTVTGLVEANGFTISGAPTLSVTGVVIAATKGLLTADTITLGPTAGVFGATLDLSAGSGGIALTGHATLGQPGALLIDMTTSGGGVTEAATASITTATLQSTGGVKGTVDLAGVGNKIGTIALFRVNGGPFSLVDTGPLNVVGTLSASSITIADSGALTISGTGTATAISLTADSISIPGLVNGGTVALFGTVGAIDETGTLIAGTLTGSAATGANLTGGAAANRIGTVDSFTAGTGFTLDDSIALTETNTLAGGSGVTILDSGALTINGMVTATAVGLTADSIRIPGTVSGTAVSLVGTVGAVTETGVLNAGTLTGSAVTSANLIGASPTINQVGTVGSFATTDFTLDDGAPLTVAGQLTVGNSATIVDSAALLVSGTIAPPSGTTAIAVGLTAATIDISGLVSDGGAGTTNLVANTIGETGTLVIGTLSGSAAGAASLTGATPTANQIGTVNGFSAGAGFTLDDGIGLVVANTVSGGPSATILDKGALTINGLVIATSVGLTADSISIPGTVSGTMVSLFGTVGSVDETGVLIAGTLTGSAVTNASLTGATPIANQVGTVNGFTAGDGFTLIDGADLVISGLLNGGSSVTVQNRTQFSGDYIQQIMGTVTGTAIDLSSWLIDITGMVSDGGSGTVKLTGQVNEFSTLVAGILSGDSSLTSASFAGASPSANQIAALGNYTANFFELNDGRSLSVGGIVTGNSINIADVGALTIGGTINTVPVGALVGNTSLSAESIAIPGKVSNTTGGATTLTATAGAIEETGIIEVNALTGSAATSANLTGATTTTNHIGLVNGFTASTGFTLNDGVALTVGSTVAGGTNVTILDKGALTISGMVTAASVGLTADSITIPGNVSGGAVMLVGTAGAISETGALVAGTLTGFAATSATLTGASATTNQVGTLNGFKAANGFTLNDGIGLTVTDTLASGPNATIVDNGALAINGAVTAATVGLTGTSITIPGIVNGNFMTAVATAGAINETGALTIGTLTGAASGSASFTGTNSIASVGAFSSNALTLIDNSNLGIIGVVNAGTSAAISVAGSLNIGGALIANTIALNTTNGISSPGAIAAANSVNLVTNGSISETGALITDVLTGSAIGNVTLTGNAASNQVTELGRFTSSGTFTLTDNIGLLITGPLSAPKIVITDANSPVTLANGATIITSGTARPPGAIANTDLPTVATSGFGAFLAVGSFTQVGDSTIEGSPSILRIDVTGPGNITLSQNTDTGLTGTGTWLILGLQTGQATGSTFVQNLDVIQTGGSGSTQLTGTVGGFSGPAAAGAAGIQPGPGSNFRFNSCPIASVNCVLVSALAIPTANPLNDINVGSLYNPNDQDDLLLPIVSDQDY
jgi:hypothetical protein